MSELAEFALNFMQTNRGRAVRRGCLVAELVTLSGCSNGAWPRGREAEWEAAVNELIADGRLAESDEGVRFVIEPAVTQGELF